MYPLYFSFFLYLKGPAGGSDELGLAKFPWPIKKYRCHPLCQEPTPFLFKSSLVPCAFCYPFLETLIGHPQPDDRLFSDVYNQCAGLGYEKR